MKAIIFESSEDLIEQLMTMERDVDNDDEYLRGIYNQSMEEIRRLHTDYPHIQKTKRYSCYIV
jgi:hypothetical protein